MYIYFYIGKRGCFSQTFEAMQGDAHAGGGLALGSVQHVAGQESGWVWDHRREQPHPGDLVYLAKALIALEAQSVLDTSSERSENGFLGRVSNSQNERKPESSTVCIVQCLDRNQHKNDNLIEFTLKKLTLNNEVNNSP